MRDSQDDKTHRTILSQDLEHIGSHLITLLSKGMGIARTGNHNGFQIGRRGIGVLSIGIMGQISRTMTEILQKGSSLLDPLLILVPYLVAVLVGTQVHPEGEIRIFTEPVSI